MTDTDSNIKIREHYSAIGFTESDGLKVAKFPGVLNLSGPQHPGQSDQPCSTALASLPRLQLDPRDLG